jgi:hypothetical protein
VRFHGQPNSLDQLLISVYSAGSAEGYHDVRELLLADADIEVNETLYFTMSKEFEFKCTYNKASRKASSLSCQ